MAIQLYRKGSTHTVRGVECECKNFKTGDLTLLLKEGWVTDPSEIDKPVDVEQEMNPIREAAKEAGIEGWDTKRIKTLQAALDERAD